MGWGSKKTTDHPPLLLDVQEWNEEAAAGGRPPPFAPGALDPSSSASDEQEIPSARVVVVDNTNAAQQGSRQGGTRNVAQQTSSVQQTGGAFGSGYNNVDTYYSLPPQVIVVRERSYDGICCPLLTFILGFSCPPLWLLACCQLSSNNPSVRFLARCSVVALILTICTSGGILLQAFSKSGKWPWETECFFPWDKKCK